jgi:hypothetical protein
MSTRLAITLLVYGMIHAVLFGAGLLLLLWTPLAADAATYFPAMVIISALISVPVAWKLAPRLRASHQRRLARQRTGS